jgi:hypothetical protein
LQAVKIAEACLVFKAGRSDSVWHLRCFFAVFSAYYHSELATTIVVQYSHLAQINQISLSFAIE